METGSGWRESWMKLETGKSSFYQCVNIFKKDTDKPAWVGICSCIISTQRPVLKKIKKKKKKMTQLNTSTLFFR